MTERRIGVWLIGALGSVSTAAILGALLLRKGLAAPVGLVTEVEPFNRLGLVGFDAMEFGGCDIREASLIDSALETLMDVSGLDPRLLDQVRTDLQGVQGAIVKGTARNCGAAIDGIGGGFEPECAAIREDIGAVMESLKAFKSSKGLDRVVVINVASTEPAPQDVSAGRDLEDLERAIDRNDNRAIRASSIYAYAAIKTGCPFVNFTPSQGALSPALIQLAERMGVPVMGNDGKTGETLVKSALAPMFACRNLEVSSWEGVNMLGNLDGRVLDNPENKASKIRTKDGSLPKILGYAPHSGVHIHYVPSLGDQKTAWDFIHFRGFLGAKMSMQFVWQGYDSLLAAPLVLDLARLADFAGRRGEKGLMPHLACYFKGPIGVDEHRLYEQYRALEDYAAEALKAAPTPTQAGRS